MEEEKKLTVSEEVEAKRQKLETKHGVKVHSIFFDTKEEFGLVEGYFLEPNRYTKRKCIDLIKLGQFSQAAEILIETTLIKEESSPLIMSQDSKHDALVLGFENQIQELVRFYVNDQKKS